MTLRGDSVVPRRSILEYAEAVRGRYMGVSKKLKGSVNLDMDLPYPGDANYDYLDCCAEYGAGHGAKIWLVPSECYDSTNLVIQENQWQPKRFLFETKLITYDDTNG